ncbi:MAG: PEP-CTERM sorting domain-containing protein [Acidobacteria bacterium]|nr:PEP-CTERM sorting domain-containing protein [Acidobacteriota bacterium]
MIFHRILPVMLAVSAAVPAVAVPISLQNATATLSQTVGANFFASSMINGNFGGGLGEGWAIYDGINAVAHTAVFETVLDFGSPGGSELTFTLSHLYTTAANHTLGRFRLSVTTDPRSNFADGLQSSGDVTANWVVVTPTLASGTGGPTMTILGDGSVLVSGTNPSTSVYTITATTLLSAITGVRLEAMEDASLPASGPGRVGSNGNFVLTEFELSASDLTIPEPTSWVLIAIGGLALSRRRV